MCLEVIAVWLMVIVMACLARMAGGGFVYLPKGWDRSPEFLFASAFGVASYLAVPSLFLAAASLVWSYCWMETGHGTAFDMGRRPEVAQGGRKQFLSMPVDALCRAVGEQLGGPFYCWAFMGLKGLLIGLPAFPFGLALAVLWPCAYEWGRRLKDWGWCRDARWCEYLSGGFAGCVVAMAIIG